MAIIIIPYHRGVMRPKIYPHRTADMLHAHIKRCYKDQLCWCAVYTLVRCCFHIYFFARLMNVRRWVRFAITIINVCCFCYFCHVRSAFFRFFRIRNSAFHKSQQFFIVLFSSFIYINFFPCCEKYCQSSRSKKNWKDKTR